MITREYQRQQRIRRQEILRRAIPVGILFALSFLAAAIYLPAFDAPIIFDGLPVIVENDDVKSVWPPAWFQWGGRWFSLLTFAIDYQVYDGRIWGFHLTNTLIHITAALLLFLLVRKTTMSLSRFPMLREHATSIAVFSALLWFAHPLTTQAVIYTVQRMESLMGMFLLGCLYFFVTGIGQTNFWRKGLFLFLSVACCYFSAFSKQVAICIPPFLFTFDYVFGQDLSPESNKEMSSIDNLAENVDQVHKSKTGIRDYPYQPSRQMARIVRTRWWYYVLLLGIVIVLGGTVRRVVNYIGTNEPMLQISDAETSSDIANRGNVPPESATTDRSNNDSINNSYSSSAINVKGLTSLSYAANQPAVLLHYLRLTFWPSGQCLDYAWPINEDRNRLGVTTAAVLAMALVGLFLVIRRHPIGFCVTAFFIAHAPRSSFVPIRDLCFEHKMYIPLAVLVPMIVGLIFVVGNRIANRKLALPVVVCATLLVALTITSYLRCQDYRSGVEIWTDVIEKAPHNPRAFTNRAFHYYGEKNFEMALADYQQALELIESPLKNIP